MFLWSGATSALQNARLRARLPHLIARELARRTLTVPGDLPLAEAVRRAQEVHAGGIVTVTQGGVPVGVVNEQALLSVPLERRAWVPTSSVARTLEAGLSLPVAIGGEDLIRAISARPAPRSTCSSTPTAASSASSPPPTSTPPSAPTPDAAAPDTNVAARVASMSEEPAHPDVPPEAHAGVHRGPLRAGEWVRLTDQKGRRHNFELVPGQAVLLQPRPPRARRPDRP